MKEIILSKGCVAIVSDEDFDRVSEFKWCATINGSKTYAVRREKLTGKRIYLHRFLCDGEIVDHINNDGLDNRRENLRAATKAQNAMNHAKRKGNYRGVFWNAQNKNWRARIGNREVGSFATEEEAARAWNEKAKSVFGEFACLNNIP